MTENDRAIEIAKLNAELEKSKTSKLYQLLTTFFGTFLVSVFGSYLLFVQNTNKNLQDFDGNYRTFVSRFVDIAINEDAEERQRFARYFASVTLNEEQRTLWKEYADYIDKLIEDNNTKIPALEKQIQDTPLGSERASLERKKRFLQSQLNSSSELKNENKVTKLINDLKNDNRETRSSARIRLTELFQANEKLVSPMLASAIKENFENYRVTLGALVVLGSVNSGWSAPGEIGDQFNALGKSKNMGDPTFKEWYDKANKNKKIINE